MDMETGEQSPGFQSPHSPFIRSLSPEASRVKVKRDKTHAHTGIAIGIGRDRYI